jgi:RES domain-containing protein
MITAWRIVKRKHVRTAFSGEGARLFGGRWNSPGTAMVYTAASQSLAALELLAHLDSAALLSAYSVIPCEFEESLVELIDSSQLPPRWRSDPPPDAIHALGNDWAASQRSAVLRVPSAIIASENNYLLNPRHPAFAGIVAGKPVAFRFDPRLRR